MIRAISLFIVGSFVTILFVGALATPVMAEIVPFVVQADAVQQAGLAGTVKTIRTALLQWATLAAVAGFGIVSVALLLRRERTTSRRIN